MWTVRKQVVGLMAGVLTLVLVTAGRQTYADGPTPTPPKTEGNDDWHYNSDYIYGMTRGLNADRDFGPGAKLTLMPLTLTLDTVLLPFGAIAGLFGEPPKPSRR